MLSVDSFIQSIYYLHLLILFRSLTVEETRAPREHPVLPCRYEESPLKWLLSKDMPHLENYWQCALSSFFPKIIFQGPNIDCNPP